MFGTILCPHNIVAGGATVGQEGRAMGDVMRRTLPVCALAAAVGGVLLLGVVAILG